MKDGEDIRDRMHRLRKEAEKIMDQETGPMSDQTSAETRQLVHDLQTHQIELELQNEELRRAQDELAESCRRYIDLYDFSPIGYVTIDAGGLIVEANLTLADMLSWERGSLVGRRFSEFIPTDDQDGYYFHRRETLAKDVRSSCRLRMLDKGGETFWVEIDSIRVPLGEHFIMRSAVLDISELRKTEMELQQSQKLEAVGTLAGGVAHNLNNILHIILNYTQMARETLPTESPGFQYLSVVTNSIHCGRGLVRDLLSFSREANGEHSPVALPAFLEDTLRLLRGIIPPHVQIRSNIVGSCGPVSGNYSELQQVVLNLCNNSWQAIPDSGGQIEVILEEFTIPGSGGSRPAALPDGQYCTITVRDNGQGMDSDILARVFEPFFTTKEPGKGTGLGLSTTHGIVTRHKGGIEIESTVGEGTLVRVFLPVCGEDVEPSEDNNYRKVSEMNFRGFHILYVDDEEAINRLAFAQLTRRGFRVTCFSSAVAALKTFKASPDAFDVVVTDQSMPCLTGTEFAAKLTAIRPGLPVMVLSGFVLDLSTEEMARGGIRKVLMKPTAIDDLVAAINSLLPEARSPEG